MSEEVRPPAVDPWKGLRAVMAVILVLEAISALFGLLVVSKFSGSNGGTFGFVLVLVLALAHIGAAKYLSRAWGIKLVVGLQVAVLAAGFVVPVMWALGALFGLVWLAVLLMRRDVARRMALGQLPSQQG